MSQKHKAVIAKIFAHPMSSNIDWKHLKSALEHEGVTIEMSNNNRAKLYKNDQEVSIHLPHQGHVIDNKADLVSLKHFLESVELTPDSL